MGLRWATKDCRKLLLTATPLKNSLLELYDLSTLIDEKFVWRDRRFSGSSTRFRQVVSGGALAED